MELWDVYDVDRNKTGRTMERGAPYLPGEYHLVVHVCVFNSRGEMLIQQRQPFKAGWPNLWDFSACGCAVQGETSQIAAERELREELGLTIDLTDARPNLTVHFIHGFDDIYLVDYEADLAGLRLQPEEVQNAKWAAREEILDMIDDGSFIQYYPSLVKLLFDMRGKHGAHR